MHKFVKGHDCFMQDDKHKNIFLDYRKMAVAKFSRFKHEIRNEVAGSKALAARSTAKFPTISDILVKFAHVPSIVTQKQLGIPHCTSSV